MILVRVRSVVTFKVHYANYNNIYYDILAPSLNQVWFYPCILSCCRFWPEHVRQRINKTYTYFASGLGITSIAAYTATQATSVMRFLATRPFAVSNTCDYYCLVLPSLYSWLLIKIRVHVKNFAKN